MSCTNSLSGQAVLVCGLGIDGCPPWLRLTVDATITVLIGLTDHLVNLVVSELLADGGHDVTELGGRDEAVVVTIEDL